MARPVHLAVIQLDTRIGDVPGNLRRATERIAEAAEGGAQLVVLPELFLTGYRPDLLGERLHHLAESRDGPSIRALAEAARRHRVHLVAGFPETRGVPGVVYNSAVLIDDEGGVLGCHAKTHLFATERLYFRAGDELRVYPTRLGNLAVLICYDMGFPEVGRVLAARGAELVLVPSAWMLEDRDLWENNLGGQATANLFFIVGANRTGYEEDLHLFGGSRVVAPRGRVVAEAPQDEECILHATVDLDEVLRARAGCGHLRDRRPELYREVLEA